MNFKVKKIIVLCLILGLLVIAIYQIQDIYASYKSSQTNNSNAEITKWTIFVNKMNITQSEEKVFTISDMTTEDEYTKNGKISPGTIVSIPIEINANDTKNTSVRYDITVDILDNEYGNFKVYDVIEKESMCEIIQTDENKYTGIITKEDITNGHIHNVKVKILWEDEEIDPEEINIEQAEGLKIKIKVQVRQYNNETIEEYEE